jgi:hypothetical protein
MPSTWSRVLLCAAMATVLTACSDTGLSRLTLGSVAVVSGDFDFVEEVLDNEGVPFDLWNGYIDRPVYDLDPSYPWEAIPNQFEDLVNVRSALLRYNSLFINCGARGLGERVYNGVDEDDHVVSDPEVIENIRTFVSTGGRLYLSDWAYDLLEAAWPSRVTFWGEDSELDAAQAGRPPLPGDEDFLSPNLKKATIIDADVLDGLDRVDDSGTVLDDTIRIAYDQDVWTVPVEVAEDATDDLGPVRVLVRGAANVNDPDAAGGMTRLEDVPLMFEFTVGRRQGKVVFTSFHNHSQVTDDVLGILRQVVLGFDRTTL